MASQARGEGQVGNMQMTRGNLAIVEADACNKELHLFEQVGDGLARYLGRAHYLGHHAAIGPDREGNDRSETLRPKWYKPRTTLSNSKAHLGPPRAVRRRSPPSPAVLRRPLPLRKVEGELRRRLIVPDVAGRIACAGDGRGLGQQPQVREDALQGLALGDDGDDAQPPPTLRASENVHVEASPQKRRPIQPRRGGVERAFEQPAPVAHGEDVRGERDDVAGSGGTPGRSDEVATPLPPPGGSLGVPVRCRRGS